MKYSIYLDAGNEPPTLRAVDSYTGEIYNWTFDGAELRYAPIGNRFPAPQVPARIKSTLRSAHAAWSMSSTMKPSSEV